jgi:Bacterial Ig-like domain (group 1)/PKD domain
MVSQRTAVLALVVALPFAIVAACDKVPLLAPTGSSITLIPVTTTVSLNSEVTIIATVIENGAAAPGTGTGAGSNVPRSGAGQPVQNGTLITFTTTIGRIEPAEARTHNGQVSVKLITGGASGSATITAYSGGALTTTTLQIGTAAAQTVIVTTSPQALGASGGTVQVVASVTDNGGNSVGGVPVTFSTDKGSISPSTATTDGSGNATAVLTTSATAKITATAGTKTGTATVTVNARSLAGFSADTNPAPAVGVPVTFTVTPVTGSNINNVHVDFGDGASTELGAISVATTTQHVYRSSGNFTATATASDANGDNQPLTTNVIVGSLPVTLAASPNPASANTPILFTASGVAGAPVDHFEWTFDDGFTATTGGPTFSRSVARRGALRVDVIVIGAGGGTIGSASLTMTITP